MKELFDYESIEANFTFKNKFGERVIHDESAQIHNGFPEEISFVAGVAESFLRSIGAVTNNEYLFMDKLSEEELSVVTNALAGMRGID